MSISPAPYFFMSYSREDTVKQRRVIKELRERGINIWVDIENLTPGTPTWEREIEKAIRDATGIIVLLSPESNNSEWVRREISFGEQHRKRIFPVLIEGDDFTSTPLRLANHQHVDLRTKYEAGLDELAAALKDYIGVKQDIATQTKLETHQTGSSKPPFDMKRVGMPALFVVLGLIVLSGGFAIIKKFIGSIPTPIVVTTPPDGDSKVTVTEPVNNDTDTPTGKIIYTCQIQGDEICIINPDGSGWKLLTDTPSASFNATLSPDGQKALYIVSDGKVSEIYELDINSGKSKKLTKFGENLGSPEISPDNQSIVFHYHSGNDNLQLWMMNRDGGDPHEFYSVSGRDVHDGTWSPDGSQILFAFGRAEKNQLYTIGFDGRDPLLLNASIDTRGRSDWSVGDLIALDMGGSWAHDVYLMNSDGSNLHRVSPTGVNAQGASLSPDGKWIAFTAYTDVAKKDLNSCEIFIMRTDGSDVRQLTNNSYCDYQPRWGN